jgi:hypothetical protein
MTKALFVISSGLKYYEKYFSITFDIVYIMFLLRMILRNDLYSECLLYFMVFVIMNGILKYNSNKSEMYASCLRLLHFTSIQLRSSLYKETFRYLIEIFKIAEIAIGMIIRTNILYFSEKEEFFIFISEILSNYCTEDFPIDEFSFSLVKFLLYITFSKFLSMNYNFDFTECRIAKFSLEGKILSIDKHFINKIFSRYSVRLKYDMWLKNNHEKKFHEFLTSESRFLLEELTKLNKQNFIMLVSNLKNNVNPKNYKYLKKVKIKFTNNNYHIYKIYCRLYNNTIEFNFKETFINNKHRERIFNENINYKSFSISKISKESKNILLSLIKLIINDSNDPKKEELNPYCSSKLNLCYDLFNILERLDNKGKRNDSNIINFDNTSFINQFQERKRKNLTESNNTFYISNEDLINLNTSNINKFLQKIERKIISDSSKESNLLNLNHSISKNIIIADDEYLFRASIVKIMIESAKKLNIKLNIIESKDGIETIKIVYEYLQMKQKIDLIISDENMSYMKGSESAEILSKNFSDKILIPKFHIVTSNDLDSINKKYITSLHTKPLKKSTALSILENILD